MQKIEAKIQPWITSVWNYVVWDDGRKVMIGLNFFANKGNYSNAFRMRPYHFAFCKAFKMQHTR